MITPVFWITQSPDQILLKIRAPHGNLSELDYDHGQNMFIFSCSPYFLRLHFRQAVEEYANGNGKMEWKSDEGEFHITIPKLHKGEHFSNLDMISELLNPEITNFHGRNLVEEVEEEDPEGNEFLVDQELAQEPDLSEDEQKVQKFGYGFGWAKIDVIERLRSEIGKLVDLQNPEDVPAEMRASECLKFDYEQFDEGRYLADTLEPEEELVSIISSTFAIKLEIDETDRTKLKDLRKPAKIRTFGSGSDEQIMTSLVDILMAYCYDQRVGGWETNCESGWTVAKLAPSLSYLCKFDGVEQAVLSSFHRLITYPLYRSFPLAQAVLQDTKTVLSAGKSAILHCLCDIHRTFIESGDFRYILNDLFITDYIFWIQSVPDKVLEGVSKHLVEFHVEKADLAWDLDVLEAEARMERVEIDSDDDPE